MIMTLNHKPSPDKSNNIQSIFKLKSAEELLEEANKWQFRTLETVYPIVLFEKFKLNVKQIFDEIKIEVYIAIGVNLVGHKDILGYWENKNGDPEFCCKILEELKVRGVQDIFIIYSDASSNTQNAISFNFANDKKISPILESKIKSNFKYAYYIKGQNLIKDLLLSYFVNNLIIFNTTFKKAIKPHRIFQNKKAAFIFLYLGICSINRKWRKPIPKGVKQ
jgi:transposase-like protein